MKNTKKNILEASRLLFNELGYSQVTIRMIAIKLEMSSGNLNYHFKKREDILEALYFDMVEVFDNRVRDLDLQTFTIKKIREDIAMSMERMVDFRFFWTDLYNLLSQNKKIKDHFEKAYKTRVKGYQFLFRNLQEDGVLKEASFKNEYKFLIARMIDFSNTWIYASSLNGKKTMTKKQVESQASSLVFLLFPYLTTKGKREFKKAMPKYFE